MYHLGEEYKDNDLSLLDRKWRYKEIYGLCKAEQQPMCIFNNIVDAIEIIVKHIKLKSNIILHVDVDVDGIGCGVITSDMLREFGLKDITYVINRDKKHGIQEKHADYFNARFMTKNNKRENLVIIVDSSTNEIETIKRFNCDVLVIDHHDSTTEISKGTCNDGVHKFVIVNNTIDNFSFEKDYYRLCNVNKDAFENVTKYHGNTDMSCGVEVYELMRVLEICLGKEKLLEYKKLYQWAGITLYTDSINTLNKRNQWFIEKTIHNNQTEVRIDTMIKSLGNYNNKLSKTFIQFKLAPIINKAIRASAGSEVVDIIMNRPNEFSTLEKYKVQQEDAISSVINENEVLNNEYVMKNVSNYGISENYNGVIASKYSNMGTDGKNAVVYSITDDKLKGSFRGRRKGVKYKEEFIKHGIIAEGHEKAFGFTADSYAELKEVMERLHEIEPDKNISYIGVGKIGEVQCEYLYNTMEDLRKNMILMYISMGNANVVSEDEINIEVPARLVTMKQAFEKYYIYDVGGIECRAFKILKGSTFKLYLEYTTEMQLFIKEIND